MIVYIIFNHIAYFSHYKLCWKIQKDYLIIFEVLFLLYFKTKNALICLGPWVPWTYGLTIIGRGEVWLSVW